MSKLQLASGDDATPLLLRVYVKAGPYFRDVLQIDPYSLPVEDEFKLYVWPSTTLRGVCAQLHAASPISKPYSRHSVRVLFRDSKLDRMRSRDTMYGITRMSRSAMVELLGSDVARDLMPKFLPHFHRADASSPMEDDEECKRFSNKTIAELELRETDALEVVVQDPLPELERRPVAQRDYRPGMGVPQRGGPPGFGFRGAPSQFAPPGAGGGGGSGAGSGWREDSAREDAAGVARPWRPAGRA